jgi:hypothetical protein
MGGRAHRPSGGRSEYGDQGGEEARPVSSKLDRTKALKVSASAKPRRKRQVIGAVALHVGAHRRHVVLVF